MLARIRSRMASRLADDKGMTLIELLVGALLGSILLISIGGFLISALSASSFTQGQSATMNNVRNTMGRIEKEIRGAYGISSCGANGTCIQIGAQTPTGGTETLRYNYVGTSLQRSVLDTSTNTWSAAQTIIERLTNNPAQPVFDCEGDSLTYMRVTIDLRVEPTPRSDPNLNVHTSVRPRNFASVANCTW